MNEEMSTKLSQDLLLAEGEDERARVIHCTDGDLTV